MCCGKKRQTMAQAHTTNANPRVPGLPSATSARSQSPYPRLVSTTASRAPRFEYTGQTALTVLSPITGKRYRFERPGARIEADPRDRSLLASVPTLRQIL